MNGANRGKKIKYFHAFHLSRNFTKAITTWIHADTFIKLKAKF